MNPKKFFEKAAEQGITPFEVRYESQSALRIKVFNDELENYEIANDSSLSCRGIYEGKTGSFKSDRCDNKVVDMALDAIKASSKSGLEGNPEFFINKGLAYKRVYGFSKTIENVTSEDLIACARKISSGVRAKDTRITNCEVNMTKSSCVDEMYNSNGLSLKSRSNYISFYVQINIKDGDDIESAFKDEICSDWQTLDIDAFIDSAVKDAQSRLGASTVPSGKYDVILSRSIVPLLLRPLLSQLSAFDVKQHLSLFEGKVGQEVLSKKLTVIENPHVKGAFASSFDSEGMPTVKKTLISSGVLETYLYDLETAKENSVQSTGNASSVNGNIRPSLGYIEVRKGRLDLDEMAHKIGKGLYITSLEGIGTGLNEQSGDYSLQAEGYLIEDGKITRPVTLITVAGNLLKDFNKIICVGSDIKITSEAVATPSIAVRKLSVSGS